MTEDRRDRAATRLEGLDLARFLALAGMVLVNFRLAMGAEGGGPDWMLGCVTGLEGRAAATFVFLAGIGLGLATRGPGRVQSMPTTLARAAFLLGAGLLNATVFEADILRFYACYFAIAAFFVRASAAALLAWAAGAVLVGLGMLFALDYDAEWNWVTLEYAGFWTPLGAVRHLFFNGWHPVFPWVAFLFVGMAASRWDLRRRALQAAMCIAGAATWLMAEFVAGELVALTRGSDGLHYVLDTSPIPPGPMYVLAGCGFASMVVGACLLAEPVLRRVRVLGLFTPAGRQTLTWYLGHIFLGMGTLEVMDRLGGQTMPDVWIAAGWFLGFAIVAGFVWSRFFRHGPLESIMRRLCG